MNKLAVVEGEQILDIFGETYFFMEGVLTHWGSAEADWARVERYVARQNERLEELLQGTRIQANRLPDSWSSSFQVLTRGLYDDVEQDEVVGTFQHADAAQGLLALTHVKLPYRNADVPHLSRVVMVSALHGQPAVPQVELTVL